MILFFFNDTATTEIYTLSLHDALPILEVAKGSGVTIRLYSEQIPMLNGAVEFAQMGIIPEGAYKNMGYAQEDSYIDPSVPEAVRSEEHTSELQSRQYLVCRLLLEKKKK